MKQEQRAVVRAAVTDHDHAAGGLDEVLDLQVDDRGFVVAASCASRCGTRRGATRARRRSRSRPRCPSRRRRRRATRTPRRRRGPSTRSSRRRRGSPARKRVPAGIGPRRTRLANGPADASHGSSTANPAASSRARYDAVPGPTAGVEAAGPGEVDGRARRVPLRHPTASSTAARPKQDVHGEVAPLPWSPWT